MANSRVLPRLAWPILAVSVLSAPGLAAPAPGQIDDRYVLNLVPAGLTPVIDGAPGEWSEKLFGRIRLENLPVEPEPATAGGESPTQIWLARHGKWEGPHDLSGWIGLALDPAALYLFGRILDDRIVPPPPRQHDPWNLGDAIEIFLDTDSSDASPKAGFSDDDYQFFLFPGHGTRPTWGVMKRGRDWVYGDIDFEGVEVVFRTLKGGGGYTFEARFPLINFPHLKTIRNGDRIGFNVALGDREPGAGGQLKYVYMTWNGKGPLVQNPQNFGSLIVHDPGNRLAAAAPADHGLEPGTVLLGLGLLAVLVLFAFVFTWLVRWIAGWPLRTRLAVAGGLGLALVVVMVLGTVLRRLSDRAVARRVGDAAREVKAVVTECSGLIKAENRTEKLRRLLQGLPVETRKSYRYFFFSVAKPGTVSLPSPGRGEAAPGRRGNPVYLGNWTGIEVRRGGRTAFHLLEDELGSRLSLVISASRRRGVDPDLFKPDPGQPVARIDLRGQGPRGEIRTAETTLGVDDAGTPGILGADPQPRPLRAVALPQTGHGTPLTAYEIALDTEGLMSTAAGRWRLVISPEDDAHIIEVHGLSTYRDGRWHGIPFRVASNAGHPLELVYGSPGPTVSVQKRAWAHPLSIGRRLDRLWIFFKCDRGFPYGSPFGTRVADVVLRYAGENVDRIPLLSGVHLENCRGRRDRHPPRMRAHVALNGIRDVVDGHHVRTRRDVLGIPLRSSPGSVLESVSIEWAENAAGPEKITVTAITGGVSIGAGNKARGEPGHPWIEKKDPGTIQRTAEAANALRHFRFTTSVVPEVAGLEPRREGQEMVAYVPVSDVSGLRLALHLVPRLSIEGVRKWAGVVLLACLLPLVLVLAADALGRARRLRIKLFLAIGLVSMPPLALLVVYLDDEIKVQLNEKIARRARTATDQVAREVKQIATRMQTIAGEAARDSRLVSLLKDRAVKDFDAEVQARLLDLEKPWPESKRNEIEILLWDAVLGKVHRSRAGPRTLGLDWLLPRVDRPGLYNHRGRILAIGHAPIGTGGEPLRWNLCVARPVRPALIARLLDDDPGVRAFALYPGTGYPYAGIDRRGNDYRFGGAREARILGLRAAAAPDTAVLQERRLGGADCTLGARILLGAMEEPVLVVGAAVDRARAFKLRNTIRRSALVVGAAMLLLFVVITFLVTRRVIDPVVGLSHAARKLAAGDEAPPGVPVQAPDEVGNLTAAFNDMAVQLKKRMQGLDLLNAGMRALNDRRTQEGILETVIEVFERALSPATVFLALHDPVSGTFHVLGGKRAGRPLAPRHLAAEGTFLLRAMKSGGPERTRALRWMALGRGEERLFRIRDRAPDRVLTLPLDYQGDAIGLIVLAFEDDVAGEAVGALEPESLTVFATMASQIAGALENARLYRLAVEDPVTGLLLPGFFEGRLKDEIQRAARHGRTLALVKLRIEEAAVVASRYGPTGLDRLLKAAARAIRSIHDREDLFAARLETHEFAIALPEASREAALELAYRLAAALVARPVSLGKGRPLKLTPRFGIAVFPADAGSFAFLLAEAERALERTDALRPDLEAGRGAAPPPEAAPVAFEETGMVLKSSRTLDIVRTIDRIADSHATVLLTGETGTGKELFAELIHRRSDRRDKPLVKVNCAALPELLLESELFGHERGAFTGAYRRKVGRFERADGGTLFLDEIGEISPSTQVKLLRVLQDKKIERLGGTESIALDVRIVAATNQDMLKRVGEGRFREDLYYRLNVISLEIPPLRERKEEIPPLVDFFIRTYNRDHGDIVAGIRPRAMDKLHNHAWPGNVRELKNVLERAMVAVDPGEYIEPEHVPFPDPGPSGPRRSPGPGARTAPPPRPRGPIGSRLAGRSEVELEHLESVVTNSRQIELLRYLQRNKTITNQEYFTMMNISRRTGLRDLTDLIRKGILLRVGSRRGATYQIKEKAAKTDS